MSLFPDLNSDRHSDSVISFRLKVEQPSGGKQGFFNSKRSDNAKILHRNALITGHPWGGGGGVTPRTYAGMARVRVRGKTAGFVNIYKYL